MMWMLALALALPMPPQGDAVETLSAPTPVGFKVGYQAAQGGQTIEERVPTGETVESWSRMITVQRFGGLARVGAHMVLDRLSGAMARSCPGATIGPIADTTDNGRSVAAIRVDCPLNTATGKPETMFARAFEGASDIHMVQYAYRAVPTPAQVAAADTYLSAVHLTGASPTP